MQGYGISFQLLLAWEDSMTHADDPVLETAISRLWPDSNERRTVVSRSAYECGTTIDRGGVAAGNTV